MPVTTEKNFENVENIWSLYQALARDETRMLSQHERDARVLIVQGRVNAGSGQGGETSGSEQKGVMQ